MLISVLDPQERDAVETRVAELSLFYERHAQLFVDTVAPIIRGESMVSLRLIEDFVKKISGEMGLLVRADDGVGGNIKVIDSRNRWLKKYKMPYFNLYHRKNGVHVEVAAGAATVPSSVGQLTYFRWLVSTGILRYIGANLAKISELRGATNKSQRLAEPTSDPVAELLTNVRSVGGSVNVVRCDFSERAIKDLLAR
jgi:hypothetical protein